MGMDFHVVDVSNERSVYPRPQRKQGEKRELSHKELLWHRLQTTFPPKTDGLLEPYGRVPPISAMTFNDRHAELSWLAETQHHELANLHETMRYNGFESASLSTTPEGEDDQVLAFNYLDYGDNLQRVAYALDPEALAPLLRQIDWERYIDACGTPIRIYAKLKDDGSLTAAAHYNGVPRLTEPPKVNGLLAERIDALRPLIAGRSRDDIANARERAYHYGKVVWASMTPDEQLAWTRRDPEVRMYLDFADDNTSRVTFADPPEERLRGPQELGFHGDGGTVQIHGYLAGAHGPDEEATPEEPSEFDLWPMTEEEFANGLPEDPGYATWT